MNPSLVFITNPCVRRLEICFHEDGMTAGRLLCRLLCPCNSDAIGSFLDPQIAEECLCEKRA